MPVESSPSEYQDCTLMLALDRFVYFGLFGWGVSAILVLLATKAKNIKLFVLFSLITGSVLVASFYLYLNLASKKISSSSVYLDTLYKD